MIDGHFGRNKQNRINIFNVRTLRMKIINFKKIDFITIKYSTV